MNLFSGVIGQHEGPAGSGLVTVSLAVVALTHEAEIGVLMRVRRDAGMRFVPRFAQQKTANLQALRHRSEVVPAVQYGNHGPSQCSGLE
jgi:hypothetical protein